MTQNLPSFIYGTAWKEDATSSLVSQAISAGFTAFDTANQRKHYFESAVGDALLLAFDQGLQRDSIFIQTKFTHINGQDHRLPYDPTTNIRNQVRQSFECSLNHLQVKYIDSYILHGPSLAVGLSDNDWLCWQEMESLHHEHQVRSLGISNVSLEQLQQLTEGANIKPIFVQNRCYASQCWDKDVRDYCINHDIHYQGFSLLTANHYLMPYLSDISTQYKKTPEQIIFRFSQQIGIIPLTGTSNPNNMHLDLSLDFNLTASELSFIENMAA